mgnify:CR=1 FL=1|jgi:uncharacterized protein with von Willebrand factor type A (vWA) domain
MGRDSDPSERDGARPDAGETRGLDDAADTDSTPDFRAAREHVLVEIARFVDDLRNEGVTVPGTGMLDAARALSVVGLGDEDRVAAALRATLVSEASDVAAFEDAFPTFWHRLRSGIDRIATAEAGPSADDGSDDDTAAVEGSDEETEDPGTLEDVEPPDLDGEGGDGDVEVRIPTDRAHASGDRASSAGESAAKRYSAVGGSSLVDDTVPAPSSGDVAAIDRFLDALATLPGRRRRRAPSGPAVDARAALRASLETGGTPLDIPHREQTPSEVRCCLLVDVSGSVLDTVDRGALLALVDRVASAALNARVFLFDTDVVEATEMVTRAEGSTAAALRAAAVEWGGGTQIGAALDTIRRTAPHAVDRRTVVVVVSDGLDVGEPELLADGITWLADRADSVVWLNPLAVSPSFEPASRGMSTVEPYLDALFGFADAADLAVAANQLERRGLDGPVGYEFESRADRTVRDGGAPE